MVLHLTTFRRDPLSSSCIRSSATARAMPAISLPQPAVEAAHSLHPRLANVAHKLADAAPALLHRRQQNMVAIPTIYAGLNSGPAPGAVVGIVLGSVAGFLIIVWLLVSSMSNGGGNVVAGEEEIVVRRRSRSRSPRSRRSRRSTRVTEVREISRSPHPRSRRQSSVPRTPPRIVEERMERERVVDRRMDGRVDGDDIVEVFEEHSDISAPPPRRKSSHRRGGSGYR